MERAGVLRTTHQCARCFGYFFFCLSIVYESHSSWSRIRMSLTCNGKPHRARRCHRCTCCWGRPSMLRRGTPEDLRWWYRCQTRWRSDPPRRPRGCRAGEHHSLKRSLLLNFHESYGLHSRVKMTIYGFLYFLSYNYLKDVQRNWNPTINCTTATGLILATMYFR